MLTIRLSRVGKRKQPSFRILVQEKGRDPWGDVVENIGNYNPLVQPAKMVVDKERLLFWIGKGAQLSDTLNNLFINEGLIEGQKRRIAKPKAAPAAPTKVGGPTEVGQEKNPEAKT